MEEILEQIEMLDGLKTKPKTVTYDGIEPRDLKELAIQKGEQIIEPNRTEGRYALYYESGGGIEVWLESTPQKVEKIITEL